MIGFKTKPTDVRAIAPATRLPGTDSLTNVVRDDRMSVLDTLEDDEAAKEAGATGTTVWKKGMYESSVRIDDKV